MASARWWRGSCARRISSPHLSLARSLAACCVVLTAARASRLFDFQTRTHMLIDDAMSSMTRVIRNNTPKERQRYALNITDA